LAIKSDRITCDVDGCEAAILIDDDFMRDLAVSDAKDKAQQEGWLLLGKNPERSAQFCFDCAKAALSREGWVPKLGVKNVG
jgi:hypothetical protein